MLRLCSSFVVTAVTIGLGLLLSSPARAQNAPGETKKPNVVLILADDLGYSDLGVQGGKDIPTPNLDLLANSGTRFTQGYVSCPVCAPTRAGLLTGRYQQRFGFDENGSAKLFPNYGLDAGQKTLADSFNSAGYATAIFGKWHLGETQGYLPNDRGFDEFFGMLHGANDYLPFTDLASNTQAWRTSGRWSDGRLRSGAGAPATELIEGRRFPLFRQKEQVTEPAHLTEAFAREGARFIAEQTTAGRPFFLYLPFNAVHVPFAMDAKYDDRFKHLSEGRREYAALLSSLDDAVGVILAKLRETGAAENTVVVFLSDNGGPSDAGPGGLNYSNNLPLRGRKNQMYEGGIRVPYFIAWPGNLPAGKTIDAPVISLDILPTVLAAAGIDHVGAPPDGKNLLPLIRGETTAPPHELLFWRMANRFAARDTRWKTIRFEDGHVELYDLKNDPSETTDVSATYPAEVERLSQAIAAWDSRNQAPRWRNNIEYPTGRPSAATPSK